MKIYSFVRFEVEGFHHWPAAPAHRSYLGHRHRHIFRVEIQIELRGDDREIEFHDLLDFARDRFVGGELGAQSCEMMAAALGQSIADRWPGRRVVVSVSEDGENGGLVVIKRKSPAVEEGQGPAVDVEEGAG